MKKADILKLAAMIALAVANAHAAAVQMAASATVTEKCAVVAPGSIPAESAVAGNANSLVNVNCFSGTAYSVRLGINDATQNKPASAVSKTDAIYTVTY